MGTIRAVVTVRSDWRRQCCRRIALALIGVALGARPAAALVCVGDCDGDGTVAMNELIVGVNIVLGSQPLSACEAFDCEGNGTVPINCLIQGVNSALNGCPGVPTITLLQTGQTQCDPGDQTLGSCPGTPAGQDGELREGAARSDTDNGDGTVTDNVTGLTWEKLSNDGSIHDYTATYTWAGAFRKVATLNSRRFAGHSDWRLPNVNELQSLANYGTVAPSVDAAFNTGCVKRCTVTSCSCTQSSVFDFYWSSTTYQPVPDSAWFVIFNDGRSGAYAKSNNYYVRAVRGGASRLPQTGQTQCDPGDQPLGSCPGTPAGQDGELREGAARSDTDNGDGTVTDNVTGLTWEKLSNDGSIHDYTAMYTWADAFAKVATLNSGSFAGHSDWRIPNINELQSIANYQNSDPAVDTAFNTSCAASCTVTTCSCTQSRYWSSTTAASFPQLAWGVYFNNGLRDNDYKAASNYARAVRGGS